MNNLLIEAQDFKFEVRRFIGFIEGTLSYYSPHDRHYVKKLIKVIMDKEEELTKAIKNEIDDLKPNNKKGLHAS